jgi:hypothetical protein
VDGQIVARANCNSPCVTEQAAFASNDGDASPDINATWLGMVGPGTCGRPYGSGSSRNIEPKGVFVELAHVGGRLFAGEHARMRIGQSQGSLDQL